MGLTQLRMDGGQHGWSRAHGVGGSSEGAYIYSKSVGKGSEG